MKKLILALFVLLTTSVFASTLLPKLDLIPGGIAIVPLNVQSNIAPKVYYQKHRVMVLPEGKAKKRWQAVVGIAASTKPGTQTLKFKNGLRTQEQTFEVKKFTYPLSHVTLKDSSTVTPNAKTAAKIASQRDEINELLLTYRPTKKVYYDFILPIKGRFSSAFGQRRIYNKIKHGRHYGQDIAATAGTPVQAAANGVVIGIGDYVITGNTVFISHGQGLISYYAHLKSVAVKLDQLVYQGEEIGTVGSTGRSTGPHLHWTVSLNGVRVNPLLFVH